MYFTSHDVWCIAGTMNHMYTCVFIDVYTYIHTNKGLVSKYMYRGYCFFLRWSIKFCVFFATCIDAHRSNIVFIYIYMTVTNWVLMSSFLLYCTVPTDRVWLFDQMLAWKRTTYSRLHVYWDWLIKRIDNTMSGLNNYVQL
jgi:hypothetical protein